MATTISADSVDAPSESLRESIAKYSTGHYSKRDMTRVLSQAVEADPGCCEAIQEFLDDRLHTRQMTTVDHRELSSILDSLTSEGLPTESSDEKPAESGLYKIDGEGTLILASDAEKAKHKPRKSPNKKVTESKPHPTTRLGPGSVLRERYRLEEEVARGSMGLVFRATDLLKLESGANSTAVAVKVINPEFANNKAALRSFQNEVANTQHLSHPNIVNLFELDKCDDHYYITMEWLEGESLDALLDRTRGSALPPIQAYAIIEQLCDALIYAHQHRVVHADIKPGNVFLTKSGELKLIDFGIAHLEEALDAKSRKNKKSIALTPAYASCECLEKQRPTAQDDLFSLACLTYRLLSGRRVFGPMTALQAEAEGVEPVPIGGVSQTRWHAIRKALAFRREGRYDDIQSFADDFGRRETPRDVPEVSEPEAPIDDIKFTETANLELSQADIEQAFRSSPDLSSIVLDDEGSDLLGASQLFADEHDAVSFPLHASEPVQNAAKQQEAAPANDVFQPEAAPQDLGDLPEPINFFDDDSDDSVFVPLDSAGAPVVESTIPIEGNVPTESTIPLESSAEFDPTKTLPGDVSLNEISSTPSVAAESPKALSDRDPVPAPLERVDPADWGYAAVPASPPAAPSDDDAGAQNGETAGTAKKQAAEKGKAAGAEVAAAKPKSSGIAIERLMKPVIRSAGLSLPQRLLVVLEERAARATGIVGALVVIVAAVLTFSGDPSADGSASLADPSGQTAPGVVQQEETVQATIGGPVSDAELFATRPEVTVPAGTGDAEVSLNRADTGIALEGTAVPVIFGAPAGTNSSANVSQQMRELNDQARRALDEGRLIGADSDNAAAWLDKMRASEPDIAFTQAIEAGLIAALLERAGRALEYRDIEDAVYWTERAAEYGASDARVSELRDAIDRLQAEARAAGASGSAAQVSGATPLAIEVPISKLEFAHYQEPEYPRLFVESGLKGWVDVRFRIGSDGVPVDMRITGTNLPPRFAAPSITAVESWRFVPYRLDGKALPVISTARINYSD